MSDSKLDPRVQAMLDREEIRANLARYNRGVDRGDVALARSAFTPDAIINIGKGEVKLADNIGMMATYKPGAMHFMGNMIIELDGDKAMSEAYWISFQTLDRDSAQFQRIRGARSVDRLVRTGDTWKIAKRTVVDDWSRIDRIVENVAGTPAHPAGPMDKDFVYSSGVAKKG